MEDHRLRFGTVFGDDVILTSTKYSGCLRVTLQKQRDVFCGTRVMLVLIGMVSLGALTGTQTLVFGAVALGVLMFYLLFQALSVITHEELLIVKNLGYQLTIKTLLRKRTEFIPYERVQTVFINEVIIRHRVIFVLMMLVNNMEPKLIPLFKDTLPRLDCLQVIYKEMKQFEAS